MKRYREYMDSVRVSGELHRELLDLNAPGKRGAPWAKYGAWAAGLVLVCALGAWGLRAGLPGAGYGERLAEWTPEDAAADLPDIVPAAPGDAAEPGEKTLGGYDVTEGEVAIHYVLPYIEYGTVEAAQAKIALDWALGEGYTEGPVSREEIAALMGGEDVLSTHLDWGGYELFGWRYDRADGTPGLVMISGHKGELDHFEFSLMYGELPPTCIAYPDSVTQEIRGLTVTADKYDGEYGSDRRVSFMMDDWGYRFDVTATDAQQAELLVSRLVRQVADKGLALSYTCPNCGHTFPFGTVHHDPLVSAEPGYTCPTCGETVPAGMAHDCAMCDGYPVPHVCDVCGEAYPAGTEHQCELCRTLTCPDCGASYPAGTDHQCEICGYPLAPDSDTYVCEICGQTCRMGQEHSHGQNHHQEGHHGGHH